MAEKTKNVVRATPDFTPNEWKTGDVLTAEKLNNTDTGVKRAINGVKALEAATAEATALAAGRPPTASWDGSKWTFGIPAGASGKNGSCIRVSATALTNGQSGIKAEALTPDNATIPYAIGDIVLDATNKKLYRITAVSGGVATIGELITTLP